MRKILDIVVVLEGVRKSECVVATLEPKIVTLVIVHVVVYVIADTMPADTLRLLDFRGKGKDLHSVVVKRIWFHQIQHIEFNFHTFRGVTDSEEVPLCVTIGIYVILQDQIVLCLRDLDSSEEVAWLKSGFEDQGPISRTLELIVLIGRHLHALTHLPRAHGFEIPLLPFNIVLFNKLLNVYQIGCRA